MQDAPRYADVVARGRATSSAARIAACEAAGIARARHRRRSRHRLRQDASTHNLDADRAARASVARLGCPRAGRRLAQELHRPPRPDGAAEAAAGRLARRRPRRRRRGRRSCASTTSPRRGRRSRSGRRSPPGRRASTRAAAPVIVRLRLRGRWAGLWRGRIRRWSAPCSDSSSAPTASAARANTRADDRRDGAARRHGGRPATSRRGAPSPPRA